jgi:hypothetical protein
MAYEKRNTTVLPSEIEEIAVFGTAGYMVCG